MDMPDESEQSEENSQEDVMPEDEQYIEGDDEPAEKILRQKLKQCLMEKDDYLLGWQRCKADAINNKQQEELKRRDIVQFAVEDLIQSLLPLLDTFHHALGGKKSSDPYVQGFGHIQTQFLSILGRYGLTIIADTGLVFDVTRHEPVETIPVSKQEDDNKILETVENGYVLHGKVIKPAKVKVGEYKTLLLK